MMHRYKTLILLLLALFGFAATLSAQTSYSFVLTGYVIDTVGGGNQGAAGQRIFVVPDPGFTGNYFGTGATVQPNGYWEDSVFIYGPGTGMLWVHTIDCHGDTLSTSINFDSTWITFPLDTLLLCAASHATCSNSFTVTNTPGLPELTFYGSSTGAGVVAQEVWYFGNATIYGPNPSHGWPNYGNHWVDYQVTRSTGCQSSTAQTISAGPSLCPATILSTLWGNMQHFSVSYYATGTPVQYDWDFGDGTTLSTTTNGFLHNYPAPGIYPTCLVTTFSDGCVDSNCVNNYFYPQWVGFCNASFTHVVNGPAIDFQDQSTASSPIIARWWDFGDGSTDSTSGSSVSHIYAAPGSYIARLETYSFDSCYDSFTDTILVPALNGCLAGFTHAPDTTGQFTILAYNTSTGTNLSYLWDFGDGSTSAAPYPIYQYAGAGTYNICLTVTQTIPTCISTYCDSVSVTQKQAAAFTFGVFAPVTAIPAPSVSNGGLQIAPHPVRERLHMWLPMQGDGPVRMRIYNAIGLLMSDRDITLASGRAEWDATQLPDGMYVVRVGTESARFWVLR